MGKFRLLHGRKGPSPGKATGGPPPFWNAVLAGDTEARAVFLQMLAITAVKTSSVIVFDNHSLKGTQVDEFESGIAPWVRLTPKSISINANNRAEACSKTISLEASMWGDGWRQSLHTSQDQDISKLKWTVDITTSDQVNHHVREQGGIGVASHVPEYATDLDAWDESISAWVALPNDQFQLLADALIAKLPLAAISLSLAGASYGGAPDGSRKKWDVAKRRDLIIKEVNWSLAALAPSDRTWNDAASQEAPPAPASQQDIGALKEAMVKKLDSLALSVGWAAVAAIATAAILFFN